MIQKQKKRFSPDRPEKRTPFFMLFYEKELRFNRNLFIFDNDDLPRTLLRALAAGGALLIINGSNEAVHMNCAGLADLGAETASDTPGIAVALDLYTFVGRRTADVNLCVKRNQTDDVLGTGLDTDTASAAFFCIDDSNPVHDTDGIVCAVNGAGAESDTAVGTFLRAAAEPHGCRTVVRTLINVFFLCVAVCAGAHDLRAHPDNSSGFHAHDSGDFVSGFLTANRAGGDFGFAVYNGFRAGTASGEAASAAVCTGQTFDDLRDTRIYLDGEDLGCNGKHGTEDKGDSRKQKERI